MAELFELHIRVVSAKDLKRVIMMGRMDPYVIITAPRATVKSHVAKDGDSTPAWDWKTMVLVSKFEQVQIAVAHEGGITSSNHHIGSFIMSDFTKLGTGEVVDAWFAIHKNGEKTGEIRLRMQLMHGGERPITPPKGAAHAHAGGAGAHPHPVHHPQQQQQQQAPPAYPGAAPPGYAAYPGTQQQQQPMMAAPQPMMQQPQMMAPQPVYQQQPMMQQQPVYQQPAMMQPQPVMMQQPMMMAPQMVAAQPMMMAQPMMAQPMMIAQPGMPMMMAAQPMGVPGMPIAGMPPMGYGYP